MSLQRDAEDAAAALDAFVGVFGDGGDDDDGGGGGGDAGGVSASPSARAGGVVGTRKA